MAKPKMFIGSSVEGLTIAYALQQNLDHEVDATVWNQGVFELSKTTIESLVATLEKCDFAVFVFSPDDIATIRMKKAQTVRDNVIFELGLFIGRLGRERSFIVMPDKPTFHIPTDLLGVTPGKYDSTRADDEGFQVRTGPVSHQIRTQIKKLGLLHNVADENASQIEQVESPIADSQKKADWFTLFLENKYKEALELLENEPYDGNNNELPYWKIILAYKIDPKKGKETILNKLEVDPSQTNYAAMARILLGEKELTTAWRVINEGLSKFDKAEVLICRKSEYLATIGKTEEAIALLSSANYQHDEDLAIRLAGLFEDEKKLEEGYAVLKEAYKNDQTSQNLKFKLARFAEEVKKYEVALYLFDELTKQYADSVEYWAYLGNACVSLNLLNKAMTSYKKAEALSESKQSWILENIGNVLNRSGLYSEGKKYFNQALALIPESEYSFDRMRGIMKSEEQEREDYLKLAKKGLSSLMEGTDVPIPVGGGSSDAT